MLDKIKNATQQQDDPIWADRSDSSGPAKRCTSFKLSEFP